MKKYFSRVVAALLVLTFLVEAVAPAAVLAASYTDSLTSCGGGVYVPKDQTCPDQSDPIFFICMVAASAAGIAAAAAFAWYPPLALALFGAAFAAGAALCPRIQPAKPNLDITGLRIQNNVTPVENATIKFLAEVSNTGGATTGTAFNNRFEYHWGANGTWVTLGSVSGGPITNGGSTNIISKSLTLSRTGRLYVRVCTDTGKVITESDESNNCSSDSKYYQVGTATLPPNLSLTLSKDRATITAGQLVNFTGTVTNNGTLAVTGLAQRICIDDVNCGSNPIPSNILGPTDSIASLGLTPITLNRSWTATAGSHTAYYCVLGNNCVPLGPFTVAAAPAAVVQCTLDTVSWNAGTERTFYSTQTAYAGDCDSGTDSNGNSYSRSLRCGATGTVTNNDSTGSYRYRTCNEVTQNAVTITANGTAGAVSVRKGSSVQIAWNGGNASSCAVTGLGTTFNGSGVVNSQAVVVNQKTIFTATCTLGSGANRTQRSATVTVNLLPIEVEN
jgi:hypothetical protein